MDTFMCSRSSWSVSPAVGESPERRSERSLQSHLQLPLLQLTGLCSTTLDLSITPMALPSLRIYGRTHLFFMILDGTGLSSILSGRTEGS